ncbi:MAG: hypothetical protein CTY18_05410 [Methylomonas sp.]|nr:MAG: hypothetical protein CTY24_14950 [Methylobacter sp.]PPD36097.1 MAG: hypothetical protein CTY18_05410 [Methylomonas sp.]
MRTNISRNDPTIKVFKRDFKIILRFVLFLFVVAIGWYLYTPPYHPPRAYPPLLDADRQRLDLQLFNELSVNGSRPPHYTVERRQQLILNMAKQGFEVADLAYQLLNVKYGMSGRHFMMPNERAAYHHLRDLAEKGDASAQCLAAKVIARWGLDMKDYERYVVQAANAGQPYCVFLMSAILNPPAKYWQQTPVDERKSEELRILAARKGVEWVQLYLVRLYSQGIKGYELNIGKAKCWLSLAEKAETGAALTEKSNLMWLAQQAQEKDINVPERYDPRQLCENKLID